MLSFRGIAGAAVAGLLSLGVIGVCAASAHDELVSSKPAADAVLEASPTQVSLVFSEPPSSAPVQLAVVDAQTHDVSDGKAKVDGATVTQSLKPSLPDGKYRISYRIVADDGHPESGMQSFTVRGAKTTSTSQATVSAPTDQSAKSGVAHHHHAAADENSSAWWIVGGGALVLCAAVGSVLVWRRRSETQTQQ